MTTTNVKTLWMKRLLLCALWWHLFSNAVNKNVVELSNVFSLVPDLLLVFLMLSDVIRLEKTGLRAAKWSVYVMVGTCLLGLVVNSSSIFNFAWGYRCSYLQIAALFVTASLCTLRDFHKLFEYLYYFFILDLLLAVYQYVVLGYYQDLNNGAFMGGAGQDFFCAAVFAYHYYMYIEKKCPIKKVAFIFAGCVLIAVLEEEKFIFIELAGIVAYQTLVSKFSVVRLALLILVVIGLSYGIDYMGEVNGHDTSTLTDINSFVEFAQMVGYGYELPRVGSSVYIEKMFFHDDANVLFGLGLGMCEDSSLSLVDTSFFERHGWLNYFYFPFQIGFLQTGWVGVISFLALFVIMIVQQWKSMLKAPRGMKAYHHITIVLSFIAIGTYWYNGTLRLGNALLPYVVLAIGFVANKYYKSNGVRCI